MSAPGPVPASSMTKEPIDRAFVKKGVDRVRDGPRALLFILKGRYIMLRWLTTNPLKNGTVEA